MSATPSVLGRMAFLTFRVVKMGDSRGVSATLAAMSLVSAQIEISSIETEAG
jgi:hypothetical protein